MAGVKGRCGGRRPGAGRKPGSRTRATGPDLDTITQMCRKLAPEMIEVLRSIARDPLAGAARATAANSLLDRGFGRAPQAIEHSGTTYQRVTLELSDEDRALLAEAREGLRDPAPTPTLAGAQPNGAANGGTRH